MKVLFLDVDGVLNDEKAYQETLNNPDKDTISYTDEPTDEHLQQIKQIVDETGAKIVLSSCWRSSNRGIQILLEAFDKYNITLYSITPVINKSCSRTEEIATWLDNHSNVDKYVIIDDELYDFTEENNFIHTDYLTGLTDKEVETAIKLLGGKE